MTTKPAIHIGFPKTATSTLQHHLFSEHSGIEYLGKIGYPGGQAQQYRDEHIARLVDELTESGREAPNLEDCRQIYAEQVAPAFEKGLVPVLSREGLAQGAPLEKKQQATNLRAIFGDARIVVVLRNPVQRYRSRYYQSLKRNNVSSRARGHGPHFVTIEEWATKAVQKESLTVLPTLDTYTELFGVDNVGVFLFEKLIADPESYYREISEFVGVDPDEGWQISRDKRENEGWTEGQIGRLREICGSGWKSLLFRWSSVKRRSKRLGLGSPDGTPRYKVELPESVRCQIDDLFREEHRAIAERWSVPLGDYGYAV